MEINKIYQAFLLTSGICTDTRKIKPDSMFFALKGENFNGNKYAEKALANGALYAVVDDPEVVLSSQYILVSDVLDFSTAAINSLHVVLPLLPVSAITVPLNWRR